MHAKLIEILRCPKTGERLRLEDAQYADEDDGGGLEGFRDKAVDPFTGGGGLGGERSHYAIPSVAPPDGSGNSVLHCDIVSRGLQFNKH